MSVLPIRKFDQYGLVLLSVLIVFIARIENMKGICIYFSGLSYFAFISCSPHFFKMAAMNKGFGHISTCKRH